MSKKIYPKLTLVGAGPGDPDLITAKAINSLKTADVILYDALVNPEILKYASPEAVIIYVGKRNHEHTYSQEQINTLIVNYAYTHGHVVRLKGGDPFVFGRGQEEINHVQSFNIETAIVPGISSSIGVPALSGIPVTHRGVSESFWVITGTTRTNQLSDDVKLAAKTNATVVILMGISKLKEIVEIYKQENKNDTAIALIQNGSLETERIALGTIETIVKVAKQEKIDSPAVIVIGEVVRQHPKFSNEFSNLNSLLTKIGGAVI
jgi:uroporphyrin-III C-methyltransferase